VLDSGVLTALHFLSLYGQIATLVAAISAGQSKQLVGSWGADARSATLLPPNFVSLTNLFAKCLVFADKSSQALTFCIDLEIKAWESSLSGFQVHLC
jgi:hypothetical protein